MAKYVMLNVQLDESQTGIKLARRNINNLRYADDSILMAESEEEQKSLLMKVKEESEKVGLKHNIKKSKITASSSIISWQFEGKNWKQRQILFSWTLKPLQIMTVTRKLKSTCLLEESYVKLSILKSRDITVPIKICIIKMMVFLVVMYGCDNRTIKKADCLRTCIQVSQ